MQDAENDLLQSTFFEEEVKKAVFESYVDGGPGPDGIPFLFYQHFWDLIKHDLMNMFDDFYKGNLDIYRFKFSIFNYYS